MSRKECREIARIATRDDEGRARTVVAYQWFTLLETLNDGTHWLAGSKGHRTLEGQGVNRVDEQTFKIVVTDGFLHRLHE